MFYTTINTILGATTLPRKFMITIILGTILYGIIYYLLSSGYLKVFQVVVPYFLYILILDISLLGILYKGFFGYEKIKNLLFSNNSTVHQPITDSSNTPPNAISAPGIPPNTTTAPPQKEVPPQSQSQSAEQTNHKPSEDELDIDLITEQDVSEEQDDSTSKEHDAPKEKDKDVSEEQDTPKEQDEPTTPKLDENDHPKLTQDNIQKYVINKSKILVDETAKSEDLKLN